MNRINKFYFYFRKERKYKLLKKLVIHEWDWCCNKNCFVTEKTNQVLFYYKKNINIFNTWYMYFVEKNNKQIQYYNFISLFDENEIIYI